MTAQQQGHGIRKAYKPNCKLEDLRNDLSAIKGRLVFITKTDDKVAALKIADELQKQFSSLLSKKQEQSQLIERLKRENQSTKVIRDQACGDNNATAVSPEVHRKLCEIIESRDKNCDRLRAKCDQLKKEKKAYEAQCQALTKRVAELKSLFERPTPQDYVIRDLSGAVELLQRQLCEVGRKSIEERNRLEERYVGILSKYEMVLHLLQSEKEKAEKDNLNLGRFLEEVKSLLVESRSKSLEEQKELIRESFRLCALGKSGGSSAGTGGTGVFEV